MGSSCKEAAFDPLGGALTELGSLPGTVLGTSWFFPPSESCPAAQALLGGAAGISTLEVSRQMPSDSHLPGMLRQDSQQRTVRLTCKGLSSCTDALCL